MDEFPCGCTTEYGPCEEHGVLQIVRDGALRNPDEADEQFIEDAKTLLGSSILSPWGRAVLRDLHLALYKDAGPVSGAGLDNHPNLRDEVNLLVDQLEAELGSSGYWVTREDGYVITKLNGGPLA